MSDLLVLCYHAASESWASPLSVSPRELERQLATLEARGYRGATFSQAVLAPPRGKTLVVTFDDAYRSVLTLAFPILQRFGFPGTVFAPTAFIGTETPMSWPGINDWLGSAHETELVPLSWPELRHLAEAGWEVGSHSRTHPRLAALEGAQLAAELTRSRRDCEERLDLPCRALAYPYGDHDARVIEAARAAGYTAACTLPEGWHRPSALRWPRIGVYHGDRGIRFRLKISRPARWLRTTRAWDLAGSLRFSQGRGGER